MVATGDGKNERDIANLRAKLEELPEDQKDYRDLLIEILQKKFAVRIGSCNNCENFSGLKLILYQRVSETNPCVVCSERSEEDVPLYTVLNGCEKWKLREKNNTLLEIAKREPTINYCLGVSYYSGDGRGRKWDP